MVTYHWNCYVLYFSSSNCSYLRIDYYQRNACCSHIGTKSIIYNHPSRYLLKETFTWTKGVAILLGFSGLLLVVSGNSQGDATLAGDGIMFIATITFVIGSLFVKKATLSVSPLVVTTYSHALASIGLLILGLFVNPVWSYAGSFAHSRITIF
jgi:drug/metabolite transporter (DMT)-like permease